MKLLKKKFIYNNFCCFILCGGLNSRLKRSGINIHKSLIKYKNFTLLEHHIKNINKLRIKNCYVNILDKEKEYNLIKKKWSKEIKIKIFKDKVPMGTYGAVKIREKNLSKNIIIIYGDNYLDLNINSLMALYNKTNCKFVIGAYKKKDLSTSGKLILKKNILIRIEEKNKKNKKDINFANAGIYIIKKNLLKNFNYNDYKKNKKDFAYHLIPDLLKKKEKIIVFKKIKKCISFDTKSLLKKNRILY
jgi:NDP-sugar pyrophosphorylase family protein